MNRRLAIASLLLLGATATRARAEDAKPAGPPAARPAPPLTPEQAADAVLAAVKAKDDAALKSLALKDDPDPWPVADELIARGEFDAAGAYARAAPRGDVAKLPAYVEAQREHPTTPALRAALGSVRGLSRDRRWKDVVAATEDWSSHPRSVTSILLGVAQSMALRGARRLEESAAGFVRVADDAEALGWLGRTDRALYEGGISACGRSDYEFARKLWERRLALAERRGDRRALATTLGNLGIVHDHLGEYPEALSYDARALVILEELGERGAIAQALNNVGVIHQCLGEYAEALAFQRRSLAIKEELKDQAGIAVTLMNIGSIYRFLGQYAKSFAYHERALAIAKDLQDAPTVARGYVNLGNLYSVVGDASAALSFYELAKTMKESLDDRAGLASVLGNIGSLHAGRGEYAEAVSYLEKALAQSERTDRRVFASTLASIGTLVKKLGEPAKALSFLERALEVNEQLHDRAEIAITLSQIANTHLASGDVSKALAALDRAQELAEATGSSQVLAYTLGVLSHARLDARQGREAADAARRAVAALRQIAGGLADEQGAAVRDDYESIYAVGARASAMAGDRAGVAYFLESGRAGALLESLRNREAIRAAAVSEPLRAAEQQARRSEIAALAGLRAAYEAGDRGKLRERRQELERAREAVGAAVGRIQREAKAVAGVLYPEADTLDAIQGRLAEGEALLLYGLYPGEALALVVRRDEARVVSLAKGEVIVDAYESLALDDKSADSSGALATLRDLVVKPLGLGPDVKRVLVSPDGPLCYVPFSLLVGEREVAYLPSGTTHGQLVASSGERGEGVLALGDPDYGVKLAAAPVPGSRAGQALSPLPATRDEVKAIGDTTLVGRDATESGLRAAVAKKRWHAVHFACHGLVEPERPMQSALALTAAGEDDGLLTAGEVFETKIPADLVVLSACETAKGKVFKGEGIVGLTRAFMFAGAPRVLCSLWKVDDDATRALMTEFYRLWNPKDGKPGLSTAAALRAAQEHVRSQPRWKHPYYWAAWQLWGLPD